MSGGEPESVLLERAALFPDYATVGELSTERLRQITESRGVDFATALLYDRVKRLERNAAFLTQIDRLRRAGFAPVSNRVANETTVGVVPAAFYKEKPRSGADGRVVREALARMNLQSELVPARSTGTLKQNSAILVEWLRRRTDRTIILVSLCKGGADVKHALGTAEAETRFASVRAWINICGTLAGSPVAEWLLRTRLRSMAAWLLLKSGGHDLEFLRELAPSQGSPLSVPLRIPPHIQLVSIVGFPLREHLSNGFMRRCHRTLSAQGPNDGGVLLGDACQIPGSIYPVWGADHYLRPNPRAAEIITAVVSLLTHSPPEPATVHSRGEPCRAT